MTVLQPPSPARPDPAAPGFSCPATPTGASLDELAALAAQLCGVPMAAISLCDARGRRLSGHAGPGPAQPALALAQALQALGQDEEVLVTDPRTDPRLADVLNAGDEVPRFCAAVPLCLGGTAAGLLLVADHRPRELSAAQRQALGTLGRLAGVQFELERRLDDLARAEASASASDERFRVVARSTVDAVWDWDIARSAMWWNEAVTVLFGHPPESVVPTLEWWAERIHPEDRERVLASFLGVIDGGGSAWHAEYRFQRADGDWAHIDDRGYVIRDGAGQPLRIVGAMHDLTQHRRSAHELQRMRAYLQNIIDSMPSVLVGVDGEGRVSTWNASAERATGLAAAQAVGRRFEQVLPQYAGLMDSVRRAIAEGQPVRAPRQAFEREGDMRFADVVTYPLAANGAVGAVIRVDDVTERVRIEQMMVQTEKMMSVGGLAAGMAHEINNPLGVILQSCQNLRRRLGTELPANHRVAQEVGLDLDALQRYLGARGLVSFVEAIQEAGERAGRIVADMLAFSRRADSAFAPERVDAMLDAVLRLAASDYDLKKQYDFKQIEIERRYDPALPGVPCVRTEIEQVLLNLVKNAAQAMAGVRGRAPRLVLRTAREGEHARIDIEDNGPGIEPAAQRRIFEPFYTTKPVGIGTGLGLSVSYFIVTDHHKGAIELESTPGEGTRFTLRLPLRQAGSLT
ncbi:PAS domain S-box protein [Azohydromonas caseinilytica]|uniref:histidine kinase n=1 Tax=Azohydromonas caseinilytica TaxID=2728836 RepID=A0A848F1Q4_9BURK|nr:PAS domain S-box protein [Azohydromonas caseinilytica]NML13614.1 PAS domain S-box protein [Azohydromonas caseinilytica]